MMKVILTLVACVGMAGMVGAQPPTMEEIVKKWDARRASIKCVKYEFDEVMTYKQLPSTTATQDKQKNPLIEFTAKSKHILILHLSTGLFRHDINGEEWDDLTSSVVPNKGTTLFDGTKIKSIRYPNSGQSDARKNNGLAADYAEIVGDFVSQEFRPEIYPIFYDIGIVPLILDQKLYPGQYHKYRPNEYADTIKFLKRDGHNSEFKFLSGPPERNPGRVEGYLTVQPKNGNVVKYYKPSLTMIFTTCLNYTNTNAGWPRLKNWSHTISYKKKFDQTFNYQVQSISYSEDDCKIDQDIKPLPGMVGIEINQRDTGNAVVPQPDMKRFKVSEGDTRIEIDKNTPASKAWRLYVLAGLYSVIAVLLCIEFRGRKQLRKSNA